MSDEIRLVDEEKGVGYAQELPPRDRVRYRLAAWLLVGLLALLLLSGVLVVMAPSDRLIDARDFLSFIKSVVPPLVTLIIGFYFNAQSNDQ